MMQFQNIAAIALPAFLALISGCNGMQQPSQPPVDTASTAQSCPAKDLQYLVGQSRTVLHTMRFGSEVRFEELGQMYTQDYKASRIRIIIGSDNKIERILCG
jgi:Peptidase inhibitor I78 family